ncbi:MAG TPA: ABC transporter ATP-binding protein, partial [Jatrophihabitans sp.]
MTIGTSNVNGRAGRAGKAGKAGKAAPSTSVPRNPNRRPGGGPPWANIGQPGEKSMNFGPSAKRLMRRLRPERVRVILVVVLAVLSIGLSVLGPKILGHATDLIFAGVFGKHLPPGTTAEQAAAGARAAGNGNVADLISHLHVHPGRGIDFTALGHVLLLVLGIYVVSALLSWMQGYILNGVVQRSVLRLRAEVEDKLNRLPLPYFDGQPRGEVLSRVTNDIDNVAQSLNQTLSQLLTSVLMVVGVVTMMFVVSPLLALIALVTIPLSMLVTKAIAKRSQKQFIAQWSHTGALNAHIEETFTGHELVKVFGHQREAEEEFREKNEKLFGASFGAQFISGIIMPAMMFIGNLNYVVIAVVGGMRVASGSMSLGDVQAFIQYSRQFTQPLTQLAS